MSILQFYRQLDEAVMRHTAPWIYVLVPGIALHELAHAVVGRRYGDVQIDWVRAQCSIEWDDTVPGWGVIAFFLAPLVVGGIVALALPVVLPAVPAAVDVWLICNWLLLAGPSIGDLVGLVTGLKN